MDKVYKPAETEVSIYAAWEKKGLFNAKIDLKKKSYTIVLPPPNANADLHLGHAMYAYEDFMIRYHKLQGFETFWLAGADHAGIETQYVFEKHLAKQGKSRFDYKRDELYQIIWDFVHQNRDTMENQLRKLGFALDWSKKKFTLDEDIVEIVNNTFKKLFDDGLVYRANRLVNYCVKDGTSFSDLEVVDKEIEGEMYYILFPLEGGGRIEIATTRPETMLGDVAVMVNPNDKRYTTLVGKTVLLPLTNRRIPIIADEYVDSEFGTGAVKVTPSHDFNDFEIAKKHKLSHPPVIGFNGKIQNTNTQFDGMKVKPAREAVVEELKKLGLLKEIKKHPMVVKTCYKCGNVLEPLPLEQWYVKVRPLADRALEAIKKKEVTFATKRFETATVQWLENFHDWNISRQPVWGIRIPAYRCVKEKDLTDQKWFVSVETPTKCEICGECSFEQDTDTFDTWFSSSQWPFATLMSLCECDGKSKDGFFDYFYPTAVMETGYDILPWWVCRMLMIGLYRTGKVPFKTIYLHGMVRDMKGQKMSKSKGNVINPLEMVEKYGADALRAALVFEVGDGMDQKLSDDKVRAMRNYMNKIWNIGRFIKLQSVGAQKGEGKSTQITEQLKKEAEEIEKKYHEHMKNYQFSLAFGLLYEFVWHRLADYYIEQLKDELKNGNIEAYRTLESVFVQSLILLHPFIPFVTDSIYMEYRGSYILESAIQK